MDQLDAIIENAPQEISRKILVKLFPELLKPVPAQCVVEIIKAQNNIIKKGGDFSFGTGQNYVSKMAHSIFPYQIERQEVAIFNGACQLSLFFKKMLDTCVSRTAGNSNAYQGNQFSVFLHGGVDVVLEALWLLSVDVKDCVLEVENKQYEVAVETFFNWRKSQKDDKAPLRMLIERLTGDVAHQFILIKGKGNMPLQTQPETFSVNLNFCEYIGLNCFSAVAFKTNVIPLESCYQIPIEPFIVHHRKFCYPIVLKDYQKFSCIMKLTQQTLEGGTRKDWDQDGSNFYVRCSKKLAHRQVIELIILQNNMVESFSVSGDIEVCDDISSQTLKSRALLKTDQSINIEARCIEQQRGFLDMSFINMNTLLKIALFTWHDWLTLESFKEAIQLLVPTQFIVREWLLSGLTRITYSKSGRMVMGALADHYSISLTFDAMVVTSIGSKHFLFRLMDDFFHTICPHHVVMKLAWE